MPELPEVQTTVNGINENLRGLIIRDVWTDYFTKFHRNKPHVKNEKYFPQFRKCVVGAKILKSERRAKNILIHLSNKYTILIHMKMTGHLLYGKYHFDSKNKKDPWSALEEGPLQDPFNRFIHLVFTLSNGKHLALSDVRKFAKVTVLETAKLAQSDDMRHLGPEPLLKTFTQKILKERLLLKPNGKIKQVLMDQGVISGIGNIYSDEILFASSIHPLSQVKKLQPTDFKNIWKYTRKILKEGIDFKGDSLSDYRNINGERGGFQYRHKAYRQTGKPCSKKDGGIIKRIVVGGRSGHFCPVHQKLR